MSAVYLLLAAISVAALLFIVARLQLHAFVALLLVPFIAALAVEIPPREIVSIVEEDVGATLGYIAIALGLGAMFGEMLRVTSVVGGAEQIANRLITGFSGGGAQ